MIMMTINLFIDVTNPISYLTFIPMMVLCNMCDVALNDTLIWKKPVNSLLQYIHLDHSIWGIKMTQSTTSIPTLTGWPSSWSHSNVAFRWLRWAIGSFLCFPLCIVLFSWFLLAAVEAMHQMFFFFSPADLWWCDTMLPCCCFDVLGLHVCLTYNFLLFLNRKEDVHSWEALSDPARTIALACTLWEIQRTNWKKKATKLVSVI